MSRRKRDRTTRDSSQDSGARLAAFMEAVAEALSDDAKTIAVDRRVAMQVEVRRKGTETVATLRMTGVPAVGDVSGEGTSRLKPGDHDVVEIGEAIASGRAFADLGARLEAAALELSITQAQHDANSGG